VRPIEEMLNEAEYANSMEPDFVSAEKFKPLREQWHLGHFIRMYNVSAETPLIFGEHLSEASAAQPDFVVYDGSGTMYCYIEVTEWLEPYRKRDLEYRNDSPRVRLVGGLPGSPPLPNPLDRLKDQLRKKFRKQYPFNTWLLVDDNVGLGIYPWADRQFGDVEEAQRVVDELKGDLTRISQVWLLRETTRPMTVHRLFP
jgi:hypothetical protein